MDAKRESRLNMYHQVIALCENNLTTIALIVAFQAAYNVFKTVVAAIVVAQTELEAQSGAGVAKRVSKRQLATLGSGIAGLVYAYADVSNNENLKAAMNISFTKILRALDDEVISICTNIYQTAFDLGAVLNDYGVSPTLLTAFQAAIADYADKAPKPRLSTARKRVMLEQARLLEIDADAVLEQRMDKLVVNFILNNNALFEREYQACRVLINPGSFSTVLKILVVNAANQLPVRNAKSYRDTSPVFKRSSDKGFVTYKNIAEGGHSFVIKRKGFANLTVSNVMIAHGHKMTVTAAMVPIGN